MEAYLISCIEFRVENSRNLYGQFILGPFVPQHAVTIANNLRKSLLSEISGVAITAVKIKGVPHEYSTIAGVREPVLDILLNVKQIVLTSNFQFQEPQIARLEVQGPAIVRASDIKFPVSVQTVDPEQYIATLLYDGVLKMEFQICRGKNYIVQTPLGLKNHGPISGSTRAEINLIKRSQLLKRKLNSTTSLSKETDSQKSVRHSTPLPQPPLKGDKGYKGYPLQSTPQKSKTMGDDTANLNSENSLNDSEEDPISSTDVFLNNKKRRRIIESESNEKRKVARFIGIMDKWAQGYEAEKNDYEVEGEEKPCNGPIDAINVLPIDAVFMPINKVNFAIETNELSEIPEDRIILEIWTNGSIHPKQAISEAAKAVIQLIAPLQESKSLKSVFLNSPKALQRKLSFSKTQKILKQKQEKKYGPSISLVNLDLSLRPYTCLKSAKIETVADLLQYSSEDLLNLKHFGKQSLNEVENVLNRMGLKLRSQKVDEMKAS